MTSDSPQDLTEIVRSYICVEVEPGVYGGWKESLLKEKLNHTEITTMLCGKCLGVVRNAWVYTEESKENDSLRCKDCLPSGKNSFPVHFIEKALDQKQAKCPFCEWSESIKKLGKHMHEECPGLPIPCPLKCPSGGYDVTKVTHVKRSHFEEHCKNECPNLFKECNGCNFKFRADGEIGDHVLSCLHVLVPCPNKCKDKSEKNTMLKRMDVKLHTYEDCPFERVDCPYRDGGCTDVIKREDLERHENEFIHKHMRLMMECLRKQTKENIQLRSKVIELENNNPIVGMTGMTEIKIEGVVQKIKDKEETEIPPFFVGHYKFQVNLRWDCEGKGNIGCYASILKGNLDDSLMWPVRYSYNYIILNQNKKHDYVKDGDISENEVKNSCASFRKPQSERNEGYGLEKFISCEECLRARHTLNDSLTFRAMIKIIPSRSNSLC